MLRMTDQILSEVMVQIKDHDEQISEGIRNMLNVMCLIQGKRSWKNWGCNQKKGSEEMICIWAIQMNLIRMTVPDKPNSRNQRYIRT